MAGNEEMHRMQEDAVRRVQEMQSRARQHLEPPRRPEQARHAPMPEKKAPPEEPPEPPPKKAVPMEEPMPQQQAVPDVFQALLKDQERTLILALLILLGSEPCDPGLLFALLFLAM
jgi:hypothetical protein